MIVEVMTFRLLGDEATFEAADSRFTQDVAYQQTGIVRRTTARGDDGEWCVVTFWSDGHEVDLVPPEADPATVTIRRYGAFVQ